MKSLKRSTILVIALLIFISLSVNINAGLGNSFFFTGLVTGFVGFCYNDRPVFDPYGPFNSQESVPFSYNFNITDQILDTLYPHIWTDNATFFDINSTTGEFTFTLPDLPDDDWVGIHPVLITYDDGVGCPNSIINTTIDINITWLNHPPEIVTNFPLINVTITEEQYQIFNLTFRDIDNENNRTYDDNNLTVEWFIDGDLVKNDSLLSPRNWSEFNYIPDYNSSGFYVVYAYLRDGEFSDLRYWLMNVTDVTVDVNITQPKNGTSLLIFDNYTIIADIRSRENQSLINCNVTLTIDNQTVFDIVGGEQYSSIIPYIGAYENLTQTWDIYTTNVGFSDLNVTADCEQGGWTFDSKYTISVNASEEFRQLFLPEGIFYNEPDVLPLFGNYQYKFAFNFINTTTHSRRVIGCLVNQSNCYDNLLPGCKQIFVNATTQYGLAYYNKTLEYVIQDDDIINSTLGGATDNWIPWRVDHCGIYYELNMSPIYEVDTNWRIHVHPMDWTSGDIANALNAKSAPNQYLKNTIHSDDQGDVTFSVTKYGGTKIELVCNDGFDNPEESDTLSDCADPECNGITYSCLPKQDFLNLSLYYSPSGSHGTLAANIPLGDIASNTSSATTFNTNIEYSMHNMPNGTLKLRLRKWGLSKTATFFIDGLPEIKTVNKYAPGDSGATGKMLYFLRKNGDPYPSDFLPQSETYPNRIALRSYIAGGTEIANLDTVLNITFADPGSIDMSEGYIVEITINYVEDSTPYEEKINITVYFDDPTYVPINDSRQRWNSINEKENDVWLNDNSITWNPCNDTKNGDFDLLNCPGNEAYCFDQSSYDCYDIDCNGIQGPGAWNAYTNLFTTGSCGYYNESQTSAMCFDGYNNDWAVEDLNLGHMNTGLTRVDCRDNDCNLISNGIWRCEYNIEYTCDDGYDNDMYNRKDCELFAGGTVNNAEYDCSAYCINATGNNTETGSQCDDNIDNDWDLFYRTDWSSSAGPNDYGYNSSTGTGMDCAWVTNRPDEDCNLTILSSGYRCELGRELTCDDNFDNDYDLGHGQPDPGWNTATYVNTFNQSFTQSTDYDDYDCQFAPLTPLNESINPVWCFDNIDNDLDAYYWNGSWKVNTTTGRDCGDPDCIGVVNPSNPNQTCLDYEYNASDPFFDGLPEPDLFCKNSFDDDADGPMDCYDSDCNKQFDLCFACPATENITWNSCADGIDNDYGINIDCADSDCYGYIGDYDHHFCTAPDGENTSYYCSDGFDNDDDGRIDCDDSNCRDAGFCPLDVCNDDIDNELNGDIDCGDFRCRFQPYCQTNTDLSGIYRPPTQTTATFGNVDLIWDSRVRQGDNFTVNLYRSQQYSSASLYLGRLSGSGLPVGEGLIGDNFNLSGPNASAFETLQYNLDGSGTKGQIEIIDQIPGTANNGFNITVQIPTTQPMLQRTFEYYHSIDGSPSLGNMLSTIILESIKPTINSIISEPNAKDSLEYGSKIWIGISASDPDNGNYNDGTIDRCYYNVSGPNGYSASGEDSDDCKFEFLNLTRDGTYAVTVWARDDTGNYADPDTTNYIVDLKPKYIRGSFSLSDRWFIPGDNISIFTQFYSDDASTITNCSVWYKSSTSSAIYIGDAPASNSGDLVSCGGNITAPIADEMYSVWFTITDTEGDIANSGAETFYICNDPTSEGNGTNGEKWSCAYADLNENNEIDICEQKEIDITLNKHDVPDPIWTGGQYLNYTITFINRGYGNATNITLTEFYSENVTFLNATPYPNLGNSVWDLGILSENQNGSVDVFVYTNESIQNHDNITNIINITYYNSTNEESSILLEINTIVNGNTPPEFVIRLPHPNEVTVGRTETLFDLDSYVFDPDLEFGDYLRYELIIISGGDKADISINSENQVVVTGKKKGNVQLRFNVTDSWNESDVSKKILIQIEKAPKGVSGYMGCFQDWECTHWSDCGEDGLRYRECRDLNKCKDTDEKPREIELCYETDPSTCYDHKRNFGEEGIDCGGPCGMDCCDNGYRDENLGEDGIDCGGICRECVKKEKPSAFELYGIVGVLTSIVLLLIIILSPKAIKLLIEKKKKEEEKISRLRKKESLWIRWIRKRYREKIPHPMKKESKKENKISKNKKKESKK